jgi:hypothetical protein
VEDDDGQESIWWNFFLAENFLDIY